MKQIVTTVLFGCAIVVAPITNAQVKVVEGNSTPQNMGTTTVPALQLDLASAPIVVPAAIQTADNHKTLQTLRSQFGIIEPIQGFHVSFAKDPNLTYKQACPFPEIKLESMFPSSPNRAHVTTLGVHRVMATVRYWIWPPRDQKTALDPVWQTVWQWDVPKSLQTQWFSEAHGSGADRYWALCLYPPQDAKIPSTPVEPQLFYFDTQNGLKWHAAIPASTILSTAPVVPVSSVRLRSVKLGITADGSRVLALLSYPEKDISLLYVFDGNGKLLKTSQFVGYTAQESGSPSWQFLRSSNGKSHVLVLQHHFDTSTDTPFLVDADGNIVTRFANDEGKPVQIIQVTDKYAVAQRLRSDGSFLHCIYQLP